MPTVTVLWGLESHSHIHLLPVALVLVIHGALQDLGGQVARSAADLCEDRTQHPVSHPRGTVPSPPRMGAQGAGSQLGSFQ